MNIRSLIAPVILALGLGAAGSVQADFGHRYWNYHDDPDDYPYYGKRYDHDYGQYYKHRDRRHYQYKHHGKQHKDHKRHYWKHRHHDRGRHHGHSKHYDRHSDHRRYDKDRHRSHQRDGDRHDRQHRNTGNRHGIGRSRIDIGYTR